MGQLQRTEQVLELPQGNLCAVIAKKGGTVRYDGIPFFLGLFSPQSCMKIVFTVRSYLFM